MSSLLMIPFPSYTIDLVDNEVVTVVTATAVKLINAPEKTVDPASLPAGTLNINMQ